MLGPAARGGTKGLWSLADGFVGLIDGYVLEMNVGSGRLSLGTPSTFGRFRWDYAE